MNSEQQAISILAFVGVTGRDDRNRITELVTPASAVITDGVRGEPRQARITVDRQGNDLRLTCTTNGQPCPASSKGNALCYHCRAALLAIAQEQESEIVICTTQAQAQEQVTRRGYGRVLTVTVGKSVTYVTVIPKRKPVKAEPIKQERGKCPCGQGLTDAVQLERGLCPQCDRSTDRKQLASVQPLPLFPDEQEGAYGKAHHIRKRRKQA